MTRTILLVTSNADSGAGSLRAALEQTQITPGNYDIVFSGNTQGTNNLGTGFYTIALASALPNLYRSDIRINAVSPRSVTILPASAAAAPNIGADRSRPLTNRNPGGVSPSLLTVGDVRELYSQAASAPRGQNDGPKVEINSVNFVRNRAQGGNGVQGGGGGLGAGGAITFLEGTLKITNSVFQDLNARAGSGGSFARGGIGSRNSGAIVLERSTNGQLGGNGGISSIPFSSDLNGVMAYSAPLVAGGIEGTRGREFGFGESPPRSRIRGGDGGIGQAAVLLGYGGGGGGGGGGRGRSFGSLVVAYGEPGAGGPGGIGARFGGSGAAGSRGGAWDPARVGLPDGTEGFAIGGAIATVNHSDSRFQNQRLILENVDFYNVSSTAQDSNRIIGAILAGASSGTDIRDVYFGSAPSDRTLLNPTAPQTGFSGVYRTAATAPFEDLPFQDGFSAPRIPDVANTRDIVLQGKPAFSDNFVIRYETGSTSLGIASDLTDPNNPFNRIWRELVPDRERAILAEYNSAANTSYWETIFTTNRLENFAWDIGKKALSLGIKNAFGNFADAVAGAATSIVKDSITYWNSLGGRANQLNVDLDANAARQEELQRYLSEASGSAQIGQVNVGIARSRVIVRDFELGRDSLVIPKPNNTTQIGFSLSTTPARTIGIDFRFQSGSSTDLDFLTVELDRESNRILNTGGIPVQEYINSMLSLSEDKKS